MFRRCMNPGRSGGNFCFSSKEDDFNSILGEPVVPYALILTEIVGATHLPLLGRKKRPPDPYCIVHVEDKMSHKTQAISEEDNPIWTVKTKSLCILSIPSFSPSDQKNAERSEETSSTSPEGNNSSQQEDGFVLFEICHGKQPLGKVQVPFEHIRKCEGEREEFPIITGTGSIRNASPNPSEMVLALRFRKATTQDILFLKEHDRSVMEDLFRDVVTPIAWSLSAISCTVSLPLEYDEIATDLDFRRTYKRSLFANYRKTDPKTGEFLLRVQPPKITVDPEDPQQEVTWMTKAQIQEEALKPSTNWIEAGHGEVGTLYLEIIGCDNLPDMDIGLNDTTDSFVAVVFEDVMVRSNVIFDTLCPRWLPWSTRAFAINIAHPGSVLFIGVFDYDESLPAEDYAVIDYHDPIGRVVINTVNFESGMTYHLHYDLKDNSRTDETRGTIKVRLRIVWKDENEVAKLALAAPPRFIINVKTKKAWAVLHYCAHGAVNMEKASMSSIKLYLSELKEYWISICCFLDLVSCIFLWRGRAKISLFRKAFSIWFPIHSIWLFISAIVAYERPNLCFPIFLYGVAWVMISTNYSRSHHPVPWYRVKRFEDFCWVFVKGSPSRAARQPVEPNAAIGEKARFAALDKLKANRMTALISAFVNTGFKALRIYSGTDITNINDTTEDNRWRLLPNQLHYPHMVLSYLIRYARAFRNFITWNSYGSFPKTVRCLVLATIWILFPMNFVARHCSRILLWTCLGPWMKLVDIIWVHKYLKTTEELWDDIVHDRQDTNYNFLTFFDAVIEHDMFRRMRKAGRLVAEDAVKLKDMREILNGKWSEMVPWEDNSRYASIPRPESSARPFTIIEEAELDDRRWRFAPGYSLTGSMIMHGHKPPQMDEYNRSETFTESKKTK